MVQSGERSEQYQKTIIELKGTAPKFHKSSITFEMIAVSQPKNKQVFNCHTVDGQN